MDRSLKMKEIKIKFGKLQSVFEPENNGDDGESGI